MQWKDILSRPIYCAHTLRDFEGNCKCLFALVCFCEIFPMFTRVYFIQSSYSLSIIFVLFDSWYFFNMIYWTSLKTIIMCTEFYTQRPRSQFNMKSAFHEAPIRARGEFPWDFVYNSKRSRKRIHVSTCQPNDIVQNRKVENAPPSTNR